MWEIWVWSLDQEELNLLDKDLLLYQVTQSYTDKFFTKKRQVKHIIYIYQCMSLYTIMYIICCSVAQMCQTLRPHWLQRARLPCPSLSPGAYSNSCSLNQWCHWTISSSVFSPSCLLFLLLSVFHSIRALSNELAFRIKWQSIAVSASALVLSMNIQDWFPLGLTGLISLQSKGLSKKHQFFGTQPSIGTLTSIHDYWKINSLLCLWKKFFRSWRFTQDMLLDQYLTWTKRLQDGGCHESNWKLRFSQQKGRWWLKK